MEVVLVIKLTTGFQTLDPLFIAIPLKAEETGKQ
jgi:hypothetical protein